MKTVVFFIFLLLFTTLVTCRLYLESPERRKEFSPEQLLNMIPLKETDSILDFGAGTGYFFHPCSEKDLRERIRARYRPCYAGNNK